MNETTRAILLAYDGSPDAELALRWAATEAARESVPVKALIVEDPDTVALASVKPRHEHLRSLQETAEISLKEYGATEASVDLRTGNPVTVLLEEARHASQVVVGSRGHNLVAEALVGSVSQELARRAPCPVVVVRKANASADHIVVGIDGSELSKAALEYACRRAEITGEVVVAIYAWKIGELHVDRRGNLPPDVGPKLDDKELLLAESVAGVRADHPDVVVIQEAIPVSPGQALVDASRKASLVVVGSRGRGPLTALVLGSVSHDVLHRARCSVAVVR